MYCIGFDFISTACDILVSFCLLLLFFSKKGFPHVCTHLCWLASYLLFFCLLLNCRLNCRLLFSSSVSSRYVDVFINFGSCIVQRCCTSLKVTINSFEISCECINSPAIFFFFLVLCVKTIFICISYCVRDSMFLVLFFAFFSELYNYNTFFSLLVFKSR